MAGPQNMNVDMGPNDKRVMKMDYPANSHKSRASYEGEAEQDQSKKVKKVISGPVLTRKKSLWRRFVETFIGDDIGSVTSYIIQEVLVPAAKHTISDMVSGSTEMMLFPEGSNRKRRRDKGGRSFVSYSDYYDDDRDSRRRKPEQSRQNHGRHNFDDIILASRGDAEEVRSCLVDLIIDYGSASIKDLYEAVDMPANYTDDKYGWDDLSGATITRLRNGGYLINLPKPILLD